MNALAREREIFLFFFLRRTTLGRSFAIHYCINFNLKSVFKSEFRFIFQYILMLDVEVTSSYAAICMPKACESAQSKQHFHLNCITKMVVVVVVFAAV